VVLVIDERALVVDAGCWRRWECNEISNKFTEQTENALLVDLRR
jgi:hypothetical protein